MAEENAVPPSCLPASGGPQDIPNREFTFRLLNVKEAAHRLGVSVSFLNKARLTDGGPIFIKIGTRVSYDPADLVSWLTERRRVSTGANGREGAA